MTKHLDPDRLLPSEALVAFVAWLTTRREVTTMSVAHDSAGPAQLVGDFIAVNQLRDPRPESVDHEIRQPEYPGGQPFPTDSAAVLDQARGGGTNLNPTP